MKLGEFFIDLVVDSSSGELTVGNLVTKMGQLEAASVGAVGVLFQLASKLAAFTDMSIQSALGLEQFTTLTGENTQELQKWQRVAEQAHISGDAVSKTVTGLSAAIAEMKMTGAGGLLPLAQRLGLDLSGKGPMQILESLRKSSEFQTLPAAQKTLLLNKVGIDPMMAKVFALSDAEFKKSSELVEGMSDHGQEQFLKMSTSLAKIGLLARQLTIDIAEWDAGPFLTTLDSITKALIGIRFIFQDFQKTSDKQVEVFDMFAHPTSEGAKKSWFEMFKSANRTILDLFGPGMAPEFLGPQLAPVPNPRELFMPAPGTTPENKTEVKINNTFSGMYTPGELTQAVIKGSQMVQDKMLADNGKVLGGGLI